jgi:two-component system OmpR family response regulator
MRVLLVEDEGRMASVISWSLAKDGLATDVTDRGLDGVSMAGAVDYDAIVLDVMLPDVDGFEVCRLLRERGVWSPVLMLTARDAVADRVKGLDSGADDYLVKPFALAELHARLRSLARRETKERPAAIEIGDFVLDPARRKAWRGETAIELSAKEFALLETLVRRRGEVLTRFDLIEHAWDLAYEARSNVVDVYVRRLRAKVDRPFGCNSIETVRGVGYRFRGEA